MFQEPALVQLQLYTETLPGLVTAVNCLLTQVTGTGEMYKGSNHFGNHFLFHAKTSLELDFLGEKNSPWGYIYIHVVFWCMRQNVTMQLESDALKKNKLAVPSYPW